MGGQDATNQPKGPQAEPQVQDVPESAQLGTTEQDQKKTSEELNRKRAALNAHNNFLGAPENKNMAEYYRKLEVIKELKKQQDAEKTHAAELLKQKVDWLNLKENPTIASDSDIRSSIEDNTKPYLQDLTEAGLDSPENIQEIKKALFLVAKGYLDKKGVWGPATAEGYFKNEFLPQFQEALKGLKDIARQTGLKPGEVLEKFSHFSNNFFVDGKIIAMQLQDFLLTKNLPGLVEAFKKYMNLGAAITTTEQEITQLKEAQSQNWRDNGNRPTTPAQKPSQPGSEEGANTGVTVASAAVTAAVAAAEQAKPEAPKPPETPPGQTSRPPEKPNTPPTVEGTKPPENPTATSGGNPDKSDQAAGSTPEEPKPEDDFGNMFTEFIGKWQEGKKNEAFAILVKGLVSFLKDTPIIGPFIAGYLNQKLEKNEKINLPEIFKKWKSAPTPPEASSIEGFVAVFETRNNHPGIKPLTKLLEDEGSMREVLQLKPDQKTSWEFLKLSSTQLNYINSNPNITPQEIVGIFKETAVSAKSKNPSPEQPPVSVPPPP